MILSRHQQCYPKFSSRQFGKMFQFTCCCSIDKVKLVGGFFESFRSRCDAAHMADVENFPSYLVTESRVYENEILKLVCAGEGKTTTVTFIFNQGAEIELV